LERSILELEENMSQKTKLQVKRACEKKLADWEKKIENLRQRTVTHYEANNAVEGKVF
jgi:exonuclease VII small subunit